MTNDNKKDSNKDNDNNNVGLLWVAIVVIIISGICTVAHLSTSHTHEFDKARETNIRLAEMMISVEREQLRYSIQHHSELMHRLTREHS